MTTPQQFGEYLLFRRLTSDAMGETFRAGKIGSQGIERVVLLRLFNGSGVQPDTLWRTVADRMGLHRILQNPHIGDGADMGRVGSVPFIAYEYVSGKSLAEMLHQARSRVFQIPTEHALFIIERLTFGLTAAYSTRHREQRIQHGFLVPENILLSNEGEVRLIGFEAGPGMREFLTAAPIREAFGPYIAPEVGPGSQQRSTDDVFALGSLLFELLTGTRLAHPEDGNFDPVIDEATLASEETPLPPALRALLKSSLAAGPQRIADIQQWQQAFSRFISEADYSPTTFNLAFFMHTLFGGEIEQESVEIEREKATQVDVAALAQTAIHEPTPGPSDTVLIPPSETGRKTSAAGAPPPPSSVGQYGGAARKTTNWKLLAPFALLAVAGGLGAAYYMSNPKGVETTDAALSQPAAGLLPEGTEPAADAIEIEGAAGDLTVVDGGERSEGEPDQTAGPASPDAVDFAAIDAPPTPEEVERQIRELVSREVEGSIQARYEEELALLRQQLEEARAAQAEEPTEAAPATTVAVQQPPARPTAPPTETVRDPRGAEVEVPAQAGASPQAAAGDVTAGGTATPPSIDAIRESEPAVTEPAVAEPAPEPVRLGDLVQPGAGVTPPSIKQRPNPRYPPGAQRLGKEATVKLKVLVDEDGRVADVTTVSDPAGFGFDDAAISAAKRTRWEPAKKEGTRVKMWVDLTIAFRPR